MAIVIPSKRQYEQNHKLAKNFIDKVESKNNDLKYKGEFDVLAETQNVDLSTNKSWQDNTERNQSKSEEETKELTHQGITANFTTYARLDTYYLTKTFYIPRYSNNKLYEILKLYSGVDGEGSPKIKYSLTYEKKEGVGTYTGGNISGANVDRYVDYSSNAPILTSIEEPIKNEFTATPDKSEYQFPNVTVEVNDMENLSRAVFTTDIDDKERPWKVLLHVKVGSRAIYYTKRTPLNSSNIIWGTNNLHVIYKKPISLEISFYSDTGEYESVEIPFTYGDGNSIFSMDSNELIQRETTFLAMEYPFKSANEIRAEKIINAYRNGKETAEILCSIGEYYDNDGTLVISSKKDEVELAETPTITIENGTIFANIEKPLDNDLYVALEKYYDDLTYHMQILISAGKTEGSINVSFITSLEDIDRIRALLQTKQVFHIGDKVIPYRHTAQGDQPLSKHRDGTTPKEFLVTGVRFILDGAVWQKLTLQEI